MNLNQDLAIVRDALGTEPTRIIGPALEALDRIEAELAREISTLREQRDLEYERAERCKRDYARLQSRELHVSFSAPVMPDPAPFQAEIEKLCRVAWDQGYDSGQDDAMQQERGNPSKPEHKNPFGSEH